MARQPRNAPGGLVFHVINRAVGRATLFRNDADFQAFERVLLQAYGRYPLRILSFCVMSNHWHFVVWPRTDDDLTNFFRWLAHTHAMRWRVSHRTVGYGPLYQGRFKSFPVQEDDHLLTVCRYVERNPVAAGMVRRSEMWRWSSLWVRSTGTQQQKALLCDWPVDRPADWIDVVNQPLPEREVASLQPSLRRGRPFGSDSWTKRMVDRLGLHHTVRPEGRPQRSVEN